jgi:hypothetical protein
VKRTGREAHQCPPSSTLAKNDGAIYLPPVNLHGIVLNYLITGTNLFVLFLISLEERLNKKTWQRRGMMVVQNIHENLQEYFKETS